MKTIVLTGSTGGLGRALAEELLHEKESELICMFRNKSKFEEVFQGKEKHIQGYLIKDEDDFSALDELIDTKRLESIVLILNAFSIVPIKRMGDFDPQEIESFVYGNVTRNLLLLNSIVRFCKRKSIGLRIVNLDSGAADFPLTGWSNYCAGKAYMNSILSVISEENPEFQVVSFDPGVMNTDMQSEIRSVKSDVFDQVETFIGYKNENKLREPSKVAKQIRERYISQWTAKCMREKIV